MLSLIPRPDPPDKEGPGIHCLCMHLIFYDISDGEGHMHDASYPRV